MNEIVMLIQELGIQYGPELASIVSIVTAAVVIIKKFAELKASVDDNLDYKELRKENKDLAHTVKVQANEIKKLREQATHVKQEDNV